jgi:predicted DsbA family dithiol-disulfide isomerase
VTRLIIYGDFNCPFSALASARADVLLAAGTHEIEWRAIQHDPSIPLDGEPVVGEQAAALSAEVAAILELSGDDAGFHLAVPPVRSNTAIASEAFAAAENDADDLRRRLFAAVWTDGRNLGDEKELARLGSGARDVVVAQRWQDAFEALPRPVTPTLVLADGYVSRGLGALTRLIEFREVATDEQQ